MELASLAQLERSHRRHDQVIAELLDVARRLAAGRPDPTDLAKVRDAISFFDRSVTRHFLDEEGSVFPRLSTRRPDLSADLAALSAEHPPQIALQAAVAAAAKDLDGEGSARPGQGKLLLDAATRLADAHRAHVAREDALFQLAHDALTAEDDAEILSEMGTRRDRDNGKPGSGGGMGTGRGRRRRDRAMTIPGHAAAMAKAAKSIKRTGKPAAPPVKAAKATTKAKARAKPKPKTKKRR